MRNRRLPRCYAWGRLCRWDDGVEDVSKILSVLFGDRRLIEMKKWHTWNTERVNRLNDERGRTSTS